MFGGLREGAGACARRQMPICSQSLGRRVAGDAADITDGACREPVAKASDPRLGGELSAKVVKAERIMLFPMWALGTSVRC